MLLAILVIEKHPAKLVNGEPGTSGSLAVAHPLRIVEGSDLRRHIVSLAPLNIVTELFSWLNSWFLNKGGGSYG